ncbi:interleukin-27 subunit beta [Pimephales promelas]|uniref:interleukin-27 subunit beta n=1 Tax=Pimephales promelas TaxID=90988 RepID=UPI001955C6FF|nr:interleukin-27 subunit beta [Pimephales promelas]KAG1934969.1 ciliary neurotrophic factor receptor subunit alpha preproprotein [Pimephales promelas]
MKAQPLCFVSIKRPKMCLICFFGALVITSGVFSQDTTTVLPEVREVFAAVGSSVKILCTDGGEKGVEWRFNSSVLISSPVLFMQNTSLKNQGIYTCHQPNGNLILTVSLHLGYPPSPPDVHCWSPTYPKRAICSWTLTPEPILPTHYIATYRSFSEPLSSARQCQKWEGQDRQCALEELEIFAGEPTLINITASNALGSTTRIWPFIFEQIVKPDPPVNVSVMVLPGKKLSVQWGPPPSWPDPVNFLLKYTVKYHWGKPGTARTLGPYESSKMVLSGLVAGRTYYIQISAKDFLDDGRTSDWSAPISATIPIN